MTAVETDRTVETSERFYIRQAWPDTTMFARTGGWTDEAHAREALAAYQAHERTNDLILSLERVTTTTTTVTERLDP